MENLKTQNSAIKVSTLLVALIFSTYFILTFFFHEHFKVQLDTLHKSIPIFFDRYRFIMMTYALLRERIIFNNSLSSYETEPGYGHNIDNYYHDLSIENDKRLLELKIQKLPILERMINFASDCDSPDFCKNIIG